MKYGSHRLQPRTFISVHWNLSVPGAVKFQKQSRLFSMRWNSNRRIMERTSRTQVRPAPVIQVWLLLPARLSPGPMILSVRSAIPRSDPLQPVRTWTISSHHMHITPFRTSMTTSCLANILFTADLTRTERLRSHHPLSVSAWLSSRQRQQQRM